MVCSNCGNTLKENEKFCTLCGTYNDPSSSLEAEAKVSKNTQKKLDKYKEESFKDIGPVEDMDESEEPKEVPKKSKTKKELADNLEDYMADNIEDNDDEMQGAQPYTIDNLMIQEYNPREDPDVAAYIGEDYKWIAERPFNIYALLLSWIYFLYRKLYLIGIIGLVITGIVYKYFQVILIPYIVLSMVGCGLAFNKIYLDIVEDRVVKLQKKANGTADFEELCRRKGGVNVIIPLIIFAIFLVIMLSSYIHYSPSTKKPNYWEETSSNTANCKSICRDFYERNKSSEEIVEELGCVVITNTEKDKIYNIYFKSTKGGNVRYVFYEYVPGGYVTLKGDSDLISKLEKEEKLSDQDEEFLEKSKKIQNELFSIKSTSDSEDNMIKRYENTSAKTHFYFTKDDLFK